MNSETMINPRILETVYSYFIPVDTRCWRGLENCCLRPKATVPKSSPAPRDNSFDCSLNRHEITVLLSYIHAHNHIPYHSNIAAQHCFERNTVQHLTGMTHGTSFSGME
jgi:hypothetical protein